MKDGRNEHRENTRATLSLDWRESPPPAARDGVITVGNFDGVHLGHAALLRQARELARSLNCPVTVITFDPHPLQLLAPERFLPPLTAIADRAEQLPQIGADAVGILKTPIELLN